VTEQEFAIDAIRRLNLSGIAYLLTGAMASNYWGMARATHDLDFVVQFSPDAIPKLVNEFRGDFHIDEQAIRAAQAPPYQFNAIDNRSGFKIDFWVLRPEPFEMSMFQRRLKISLSGEQSWIATAEDMILQKLRWNLLTPSERQVADAAGIVALQSENLDRVYLEKWARQLGIAEKVNKLLSGEIKPKTT
jgi:hypothetical protein